MVVSPAHDDVDDGLLLLAYEEAGHAVVAWLEGARLGNVTLLQDVDGTGHGNVQYWPAWVVPTTRAAIKYARISLGGPVADMIYTDSYELWNDDAHDVENADEHLSGTGLTWQDLLPEVREALKAYWPKVVLLAEALLQRQRLSGEEAAEVFEAACPASLRHFEREDREG